MARKPRAQKATRKSPAAAPIDAIVEAALAEAATLGWREVTMAAVAARAGVSLGALLSEAPTKAHLVCRFLAHLDRATLAGVTTPDLSASARDRLFEVLMRRFDALNRHRDG